MLAHLRAKWRDDQAHHEDFVQDALVAFARHEGRFATTGKLNAFAAKVVDNVAKSAARKGERRSRIFETAGGTTDPGGEGGAQTGSDPAEATEQAIDAVERAIPEYDVATINLAVRSIRKLEPSEMKLEAVEERLAELALTAHLMARRDPSGRASAIAATLMALADKNEKADAGLEKAARKHLGPYRGPLSRTVQAADFVNAVRRGSPRGILNMLRSSPEIAKDTRVPHLGVSWDGQAEAEALEAITDVVRSSVLQRAASLQEDETANRIDRATALPIAREILRQLGASPDALRRLDQTDRAQRRRRKKKTRPS